ncbi:DNA-binding transcriptional MerR regulator [Pedobacter africanus]|uniref:DNA-binding transcriptional MerR regulator n=1 Tax=Pedobacter africanus TaxID=151894 RepID=A0ACC6KU60_9SPHI|nr:neuraminidase-like domain-containing protein [Pedobacter africanus]MDR6782684.1 DNA-binding transcriptional MerR regulator [Pedobacter africanus]
MKKKVIESEAGDARLMENIKLFSANFKGKAGLTDAFTKLYLKNDGNVPSVLAQLSGNKLFSKKTLADISFTFGLMTWAGANQVLMDTFRGDSAVNSLRDIALNYNKEALSKKIDNTATPPLQNKKDFINGLYTNLYALEPTAIIVNMINDPKVPLWNNETGKIISSILSRVPDFKITTTSVYELINDEQLLKPVAKKYIDTVIHNLKVLQRVTLMSPVPEAVPVLINKNYLSVPAVTALPLKQFIATMQGTELSTDILKRIYTAAQKKKAFYEHSLLSIKEAGMKTGIAMIDGNSSGKSGASAVDPDVEGILSKNNLSWNLLFGDADFCECGECTSVYSATAYYVDLLQYLRNNNLDTGKVKTGTEDNPPLQTLFARRPDLGHLELSCKNTNTILPYVDLVNEVMEQYIVLKPGGFNNYKGFNVDKETSGELLSAPQHTSKEAYKVLQEAFFPFSLPYHQPIDAIRIFLKQLNTSRYELMDTFQNNHSDIRLEVAADAEFLALTEEEYRIITKKNFDGTNDSRNTKEYYGLAVATNWRERLCRVKDEFLPRTGLLYTELVGLLQTEYINPGLVVPEYGEMLRSLSQPLAAAWLTYQDDMGGNLLTDNPQLKKLLDKYDEKTRLQKLSSFFESIPGCFALNSPDNDCNLDKVTLLRYDEDFLSEDDYNKFNRFIRLWRKMGFTIEETDQVIMSLGSGDITPIMIHRLMAVKKIIDLTGIELSKLLCFWGNIGTAGENALFNRLFIAHNLAAIDPVFTTKLSGTEMLADHLPAIMATLNLSANDISLISTYKSLSGPLTLTLEHLSLLYRYRLLSKMLGLNISRLINLMEVVGDVFESPHITLRFLDQIAEAETAGFTFDQLSYMVNGTGNLSHLDNKATLALAKDIYDGQTAIEMEHADIVPDAAATSDAEKLESIISKATTELVRSKATLLFETDRAEQLISILEGTTVYSTSAPLLADTVLTDSATLGAALKLKIKYRRNDDTGTGSLQVNGALTANELAELEGAVPGTNAWTQAVAEIKRQQDELFNDILAGIFVTSPVETTLLKSENNTSSAPQKRIAFLEVFLPYLREKLIQIHVVATLSAQTGLDHLLVQSLIKNILKPDGASLYAQLTAPSTSLAPASWYGKLIPASEDNFTFIVRVGTNVTFKLSLDNVVVLEHTGIPSNGDFELRSEAIKLSAGKVCQLSLEGILPENLFWKTETSAIENIPAKALLPDAKLKAIRSALRQLGKMAILVKTLALSADELNHIQANHSDFGDINFSDLSFYHLIRIIRYCRLRDSLPKTSLNLLQFWEQLNQAGANLTEQIAQLTKWKQEQISKLISGPHFNLVAADFRNEKNLLKLQQALSVATNIGVDIDTLFQWAIPSFAFDATRAIAESIQMALRAKYNQSDWEQVVKPLNDVLRNNQKNALIAYLLQQPELKTAGVTDADGLFEYFLIDVQMETCMETSRVKQAISSVQLFVQRCFLGLEEVIYGIAPNALDRERWEWMQHYRVWEANRKVFLYPENWIDSNLRDDKSPFFKELESELLQQDINQQNVTEALKTYLYKVGEIANMEVIGLYIEGKKNGDTVWQDGARLHVFSRSRNAPYFFYYRYMALDEMNWYPWEKIQVDIPSYDVLFTDGRILGNGCYLTPVILNGRLMIFFPQITAKTKPNIGSGQIKTLADKTQDQLKPIEYREIKMAYSEYKNGKWTQKQLSTDCLYDVRLSLPSLGAYNFYPVISGGFVKITVYGNYAGRYKIGAFDFDGTLHTGTVSSSELGGPDAIYFDYSNGKRSNQDHEERLNILFDNFLVTKFRWVPNRSTWAWESYPFWFVNAAKLIELSNLPQLKELFDYTLSIPADGLENAFGKTAHASYHELKRPYSLYNWELYFHTPVMIADALSKAQQFEEAMKWFHYVFNPIAEGTDDKRFWMFGPFKETDSKNILAQIFGSLGANEPDPAISEWRNNPFKPHVVARSRPVAYMKWVVMKYIDNILDWGDYLFRQDTIESINQATQLYVLAGHILGRKPMVIPKRGELSAQSYNSLMDKWDAFSNAISEMEIAAIYNIQQLGYSDETAGETAVADIFGTASALYFCIPNNPKLTAYWDTLADRLFKIRHCLNIEGVFRKLPLFEAPIDPALLVKAAAQGLSLSSVVNDLNTSMPNYRFYYLLQKALELCGELKSMGGAILAAIEKKDNETVTLIRARHESTANNLMMEIKKLQLEEAQKSLDALLQNRKAPEARMKYYLQLIGEDVGKIPGQDTDFAELANGIDQPVDESGLKLSKFEKEEMDKSFEAHKLQTEVGQKELLASILHLLPTAAVDAKPFGIGLGVQFGGPMLGGAMQAWAKALQNDANVKTYVASIAAKKGGFQRAMQERIFQTNAAGFELKQIDKQITTQQIRIDMANQEIRNQQKQIDNAAEIEEFLKNKYSNEELYTWMRGSLKTLYRQVYNLAYDLAKKAEKTYCFERGISNTNFIQSTYFDAGREGLLAGEQLYVGLKQLETAYQEKRGYDYEITKHVSVCKLDPFALLQLKTTGTCEFDLPEVLFDMDYPGHFKRRIKSISVSIPCIAGPYVGVNATLRLLNNKFRNSSISNNYPEKTDEQDERFIAYNIPITAIAASSAQNDAGMFELNFKDERYLPFEGAGVISRWRLGLPELRQFDYTHIADIVLHVKYTACEGGQQLKASAVQSVSGQLNKVSQQLNETGMHLLIGLRQDIPSGWNLLKTGGTVNLSIDKSRLPYMVQGMNVGLKQVTFMAQVKGNPQTFTMTLDNSTVTLELNTELGTLIGTSMAIQLETLFTLSVAEADKGKIEDLVLLIKYGM